MGPPKCRKRGAEIPMPENSYRSRMSEPDDDVPIDAPHSESCENGDLLRQLTGIMATFVETTNQRSTTTTTGADVLPNFNPADTEFTSEKWCRKVDECRIVFHWSEETTIYFAISKLKGMAELWYKSLPVMMHTWDEWKQKLKVAFPSYTDYHALLGRMMARRKKPDEDYITYYYCKLSLLNELDITGHRAVSCIIGDISDIVVKTGAKAGQHQTPESLLQYLSSFGGTSLLKSEAQYSRKPYYLNDRSKLNIQKPVVNFSSMTENRLICFKCQKSGHTANRCLSKDKSNRCGICREYGHLARDCKIRHQEKPTEKKTVHLIGKSILGEPSNRKFHKDVLVNQQLTQAYIDLGSSCTTITQKEIDKLKLVVDSTKVSTLHGYGDGSVITLGTVEIKLQVDAVDAKVFADVVSNSVQDVPILIGRNFTELPNIGMVKTDSELRFFRYRKHDIKHGEKLILYVLEETIIPPQHIGHVSVYSNSVGCDIFVENSLRMIPGQEHEIPATVLRLQENSIPVLPVINLSQQPVKFKGAKVIARGWECQEDLIPKTIHKITKSIRADLPWDELQVGEIKAENRQKLKDLLSEYRDCFALKPDELGCARGVQMEITLQKDAAFSYRPYRMAPSETKRVQEMVNELLDAEIIQKSNSYYASPILLVDKKNGEKRMCVDYRKLNSQTVKDSHPIPRISDQIDRLSGGKFFTSLDLKMGYYQIPVKEESRKYTSFVTPFGQYEYLRMPFGLTNAPRVFQRYMNEALRPVADIAAAYLDDILLHATTEEKAIEDLRRVFEVLRQEGLTLNYEKCAFLKEAVNYLGFEVSGGAVRPGNAKIDAVKNFPTPVNVLQVRQFIGLTGYFRHFVRDYARIAQPLTNLTRKSVPWCWEEEQENAFQCLKVKLSTRPILTLYDPKLPTELHTDASSMGLAGMLLQKQISDERLHAVAYYSRQTNQHERKYHSYELETLAVVESIKKFRIYLLDIVFIVVTDCNALKASSSKSNLIPRIARWWLQLLEFKFNVQYRPGNQMRHVDALSRNPVENQNFPRTILQLEKSDWVLAGQLTDSKIQQLHRILSGSPVSEYEQKVCHNYALREGRIYRITSKGLKWVVPKGMRQQVVRVAHDESGHFALEKTLCRISECYWFPRMRNYVLDYIACCIPCISNKKPSGKQEGFLHPIPKPMQPFNTIHMDHLGPFPKSKRGNLYIIAAIDACTKFIFMKAVKSTKTLLVIKFINDLYITYGKPKYIISDQGSSFTSNKFLKHCNDNQITHIKTAVATPRANGQIERLHRSILSVLMTGILEGDLWDHNVSSAQFAINNIKNSSTGKTPSELMMGYKPRYGSDLILRDEVQKIPTIIDNLLLARQEACEKVALIQQRQKKLFDKKRKAPRNYQVGDVVVVQKTEAATGESRKLMAPYSHPMRVKAVLANDRYLVADLPNSHRNAGRRATYERVIAVDKMKPWCKPGGVSDDSDVEDPSVKDFDGVVLNDSDDAKIEDSDDESPRGEATV